MSDPRALTYRRVGTSTYDVHDANGTLLGRVWRTRHGWSSSTPNGEARSVDYPGSRGVAAGVLKGEPPHEPCSLCRAGCYQDVPCSCARGCAFHPAPTA
jgi:hypothetical protein